MQCRQKLCNAALCNAVPAKLYNAAQYNAVPAKLCKAAQYHAVGQSCAMQRSPMQYAKAVQCSGVQCRECMQRYAMQCCAMQYAKAVQCSAVPCKALADLSNAVLAKLRCAMQCGKCKQQEGEGSALLVPAAVPPAVLEGRQQRTASRLVRPGAQMGP